VGIILSAVYTLNMIRKIFYGEIKRSVETVPDLQWNEKLALGIIVIMILWIGIYPQTLLNITESFSKDFLDKINIRY
jgi:NADH-quinone oxidoreductase subunit M